MSHQGNGGRVATVTGVNVISIVTQKGGVGKTTLTVGLAAHWAAKGKTVAFVDLDPQANASRALPCEREGTSLSLLLGEALNDPARVVEDHEWGVFAGDVFGLHGGVEMGDLVVPISTATAGSKALARLLTRARQEFDYILVDTPPNTGSLTQSAVIASDAVVTVTNLARWAAEGAARASRLVTSLRDSGETNAQFIGAVINRPGPKRVVSTQVKEDFKATNIPILGEIPERVAVQEGEYLGEPAAVSNKEIAAAFAKVAKQIERSSRAVSERTDKEPAAARA